MLYTNTSLKIEKYILTNGDAIPALSLGERGPGRRHLVLPAPVNLKEIDRGMNFFLSLGKTKAGNLRIDYGNNSKYLYMVLSSYKRSPRYGSGRIWEIGGDGRTIKVVRLGQAVGKGANRGARGPVKGTWNVDILEVAPNSILRVDWSGSDKYGFSKTYYFVDEKFHVAEVDEENVPAYYAERGIEMPEFFKEKFAAVA